MAVGLLPAKAKPLQLDRRHCYLVVCRNERDLAAGRTPRWQPLSRGGFKVVFPSYLEATEGMLLVAQEAIPFPWWLDEDQYDRWLLAHYFRIVPYVATGRGEVMFSQWRRGWRPSARDIVEGVTSSSFNEVIRPLLTGRVGEELEHAPVVGGLHPD